MHQVPSKHHLFLEYANARTGVWTDDEGCRMVGTYAGIYEPTRVIATLCQNM